MPVGGIVGRGGRPPISIIAAAAHDPPATAKSSTRAKSSTATPTTTAAVFTAAAMCASQSASISSTIPNRRDWPQCPGWYTAARHATQCCSHACRGTGRHGR